MTENLAGRQYEKMTKTPVHRLVLTLAVPTVISMLITSIYNMADTYFVSGIGTSASGATGVVFGLMAIIQAFGFMFGHGAGSNISRLLGSRDVETARNYSATGFWLAFVFGIAILVLGLIFQIPLMDVLGSTNSILPYAKTYSTFILLAAPAMTTSCVMNNILRYEGKATFAMCGLASGGLLNILGDFVLIRCFKLGIAGAGISTAISQYIAVGILMLPFLTGRVQSCFKFGYIKFERDLILKIISVGMPSMMRQGLNSVSVMVLNFCASPYGDAAIAAMSITTRIVNFMFCVSVGIGQGFQPVSAFNYGAKNYARVKSACIFTCISSVVLMVVASGFGFIFADRLIEFFRNDSEVIKIGTTALRLQSLSLVLMPVSLCGNMLFQSVGKGGIGSVLAAIRSGIVFIPVIFVMSRCFGVFGIQLSQPIADAVASAVSLPFMVSFFKKLPNGGEEYR